MESPNVGRDRRVLPVAVLAKSLVGREFVHDDARGPRPAVRRRRHRLGGTGQCSGGAGTDVPPLRPGPAVPPAPPVDDWLPEDHPARFVAEPVDELLDLGPIYASYESFDGAPPYDPTMMLKLLLWGYSCGVTSSREMERHCGTDVAFRYLRANQAPDYRSITRFRRRHLGALEDLFVQVLACCAEAGLVKRGRVALDGTKLRASASRHKAMSCGRLGPRIDELEAEVRDLLAKAEVADRREDEVFGADRCGDELPAELACRETRLKKMRAAKAAIEHDAKEKAAAKARAKAEKEGRSDDEVHEAADAAAKKARPDKRAQRSFTDPESRMMKTNDGFHYAYNAQAVVDEEAQVILALSVIQAVGDVGELFSMADRMVDNLAAAGIEGEPGVILADAGCCSDDNLKKADRSEHDWLIATGRLKPHERVPDAWRGPIPKDATLRERMARAATHQGGSDRLRPQEGDRRARLRPDEGPPACRPPPPARPRRGHRRLDAARHLPQPAQAREPAGGHGCDGLTATAADPPSPAGPADTLFAGGGTGSNSIPGI